MRTLLVKSTYLDFYKKKQPISLVKHFNKLKEIRFEKDTFGYSASMASVFSSMIEGNTIDFDSYLKYNSDGFNTKSKFYLEIQDLIKAYEFANKSGLNFSNMLKAHTILSKTIIDDPKYRGQIRDRNVSVWGSGVKVYSGASPKIVEDETIKLFNDIEILKNREMSISETFYFASMLHLVFAKIHPFGDGNGRSARLIEKWFLSEKLGHNAWFIQSERLYQTRIKSYYKNIDIGSDYSNINYDLSIPFLLMLPMALTIKKYGR